MKTYTTQSEFGTIEVARTEGIQCPRCKKFHSQINSAWSLCLDCVEVLLEIADGHSYCPPAGIQLAKDMEPILRSYVILMYDYKRVNGIKMDAEIIYPAFEEITEMISHWKAR